MTNEEKYLAKTAGEYSGDLPNPVTREEQYLAKIAEGSSVDAYTKSETNALLADKQDTYTADATAWDTTPTANSTKPVTSGGIYTANGGCVTVYLTQAEYDLLDPPDENTEYNIVESTPTPSLSLQSAPGETRGIETEDEPTIEDGDMR